MSWTYVPDQVSEAGQQGNSDCGRSATSSATPPVSRCSSPGCATEASTRPPCGTTSPHSTGDRGVDGWIASLAVSPASRIPSPDRDSEKMTSVIYGPRSSESFAMWNPESRSWRTFQASLLGEWEEFSESLPRAGMTRSGTAYRLQPLAPLTGGIAFGSWLTPSVEDAGREASAEWAERWAHGETPPTCHQRLRTQVAARLWPTPATRDHHAQGAGLNTKARSASLATVVQKRPDLWPTPRQSDYKGTGPLGSKSHKHMLDRRYLEATVQDNEQRSGGLNPRWVEWLMGWPPEWTNPRCSLVDAEADTWEHEPIGVSRLAAKSMPPSERRARLSIIGNGWVPQVAMVVFARIAAALHDG